MHMYINIDNGKVKNRQINEIVENFGKTREESEFLFKLTDVFNMVNRKQILTRPKYTDIHYRI